MSESITLSESNDSTQSTNETPVNTGVSEISQETSHDVSGTSEISHESSPQLSVSERYQAILDKVSANPNDRLSNEELDLISDVRNGKQKLEEVEGEIENADATDDTPTEPMDALNLEIKEIMETMGVDKFEDLPRTLKTTLEAKNTEIQEAKSQIDKFTQNEKELAPLFQNMEQLAIRLFNGDPLAKAQMADILKNRGIDPRSIQPLEGVAGEINPDDFLDPEAYKAVTGKISKLENSVNEFLLAKQEEKRVAEEKVAQERAQESTVGEFTSLVEKFPVFGLKPHQVREGIQSFFKTGVMPASLKPLIELVHFTDKTNQERGYQLKLEDAYKLQQFEKMPERIADEIKKAKTSFIKQKVNPSLSSAQNRSSQGLGGTVHTQSALAAMAKSGNYPDSWKTGAALNPALIPAADMQVLQTIWAAQRRG